MIDEEYDKYYINCDLCGLLYIPGFMDLEDAVKYAKDDGWDYVKGLYHDWEIGKGYGVEMLKKADTI